MRCLELPIFYRCVNRCAFCSNTAQMGAFGEHPLTLEEIRGILRAKRAAGFGHVTFTGGEPTLHPAFLEALAEAKSLGLRTQAVSNGCALAIKPFADAALPRLDELCLSIHGSRAAVHDKVTGNPRSFRRLKAALAAVARAKRDVFLIVNVVVSKLNVDDLEGVARLALAQKRLRQLWVSSLIPEGEALRRWRSLAVPYRRVLERLPAVAEAARRRGATLRLFGFPPCVLGELRVHDSGLYKNPNAAVERVVRRGRAGLRSLPRGLKPPERGKTRRCAGCGLRARCQGVWKAYLRRFGDGELEAQP